MQGVIYARRQRGGRCVRKANVELHVLARE